MKKLLTFFTVFFLSTPCHAALTVWAHDYLKEMEKFALPSESSDTVLTCRVTPGEYEPAAFGVRSSDTGKLKVTFVAGEDSRGLPEDWVELFEVRSLSQNTRYNRLYELSGPVDLPADKNIYFWITLHPPENAEAGLYTARVLLEAGTTKRAITLQCEVLPFRLAESPILGGVFMAGTDLPATWYRDMKEHGLDAIQFF